MAAADPPPLEEALRRLASLVPRRADGVEAYLVGGAVRDALLGRPVREADIAIAGDIARFAAQAAEALATRPVPLGTRFDVWRLPVEQTYIDLAPLRGAGIAGDLAQRDLTVNSMAVPLTDLAGRTGLRGLRREMVIDPCGGLPDLDHRVLRLTRPDALAVDPLRSLRAIRLACELEFEIAPETRAQIAATGARLTDVAAERVGTELIRLFETSNAAHGLRLMDACGLLAVCFEPLEAGRDLEQRPFHRYTVLEHVLVAAEWMDVLLSTDRPAEDISATIWTQLWEEAGWITSKWGPTRAHLLRHAAPLRAAALLHDVGKPATLTVEVGGRTRFFGHAEAGADLAAALLRRWRLPGAFIERVALLVRQHLRPGQAGSPGVPPTARALHRFQRALGDATPDVCWLFLADSLATAGADRLLPSWQAYVAHVHQIITWAPPPQAAAVRRLIDGHAVMEAAGIPPGPLVGRILEDVDEAVAAGDVQTVDEALALARRLASGGRGLGDGS